VKKRTLLSMDRDESGAWGELGVFISFSGSRKNVYDAVFYQFRKQGSACAEEKVVTRKKKQSTIFFGRGSFRFL